MIQTMRDCFWDEIYKMAQSDSDIVIVSADFAAPSLDKFRQDFPERFINVGISEQNAILVATGLAIAGKKTIAYAITQFISLRCFEQIRIYPCGMKLPITIVGVGAGLSYYESGSTHHCIEQLSIMRTLPNLNIINCSDTNMSRKIPNYVMNSENACYVQLEREIVDIDTSNIDFFKGYRTFGMKKDILIITTGIMTNEILKTSVDLNCELYIMDLFKIPVNVELFIEELAGVKQIITVEENTLAGGIGSYILEILSDNGFFIPVKRLALDIKNGYLPSYNYGGREAIRKEYGIGHEVIVENIQRYIT